MGGLCQSLQHKEQYLIGVNEQWKKMLRQALLCSETDYSKMLGQLFKIIFSE